MGANHQLPKQSPGHGLGREAAPALAATVALVSSGLRRDPVLSVSSLSVYIFCGRRFTG